MSEPTVIVRDGLPAIDVKDRSTYWCTLLHDDLEAIGEAEVERIYDGLREGFWEHYAPEIARAHSYGRLWADGRSGGWLVVEGVPAFWEYDEADLSAAERELAELRARRLTPPAPSEDFLPDAVTSIGQKIYEAEEMAKMAKARDRFRKFAEAIMAEIDYLRDQFAEQVREEAERVRREPALRADAAARDIITID